MLQYQGNKSTKLLLDNGKESSSKKARHIKIRHYFFSDLIQKGEVETKYCSTNDMIADFSTKSLHGTKFKDLRKIFFNLKE